MHRILKKIFLIIVIYLMVSLITQPSRCVTAAQAAISLCLDTVIPVLFPFFVCSSLLTALGFPSICSRVLSPVMRPLFNLPGCGALTLFMGILSGYPVGAVTAANLYTAGHCTKAEAQRMTAFCNNSGPLFVIGVLGSSYLGSTEAGVRLYISHIVAAMIVGLMLKFLPDPCEAPHTLPPSAEKNKRAALLSLGGIIDSSVFSILKICGFVIFFAVFSVFLPPIPFLYPLIEVVGGLKSFSCLNIPFLLPCISFFLAFSGLSVIFQVSAIVKPFGLSVKPYIAGKLIQGVVSFAITQLSLVVFPLSKAVFSPLGENSAPIYSPLSLAASSVITSLLCALILGILMIVIMLLRNTKQPSP